MLIYLIIILTVITRFVPHLANFAPITALAIFSAAYLPWKKSAALTLAARLVSDMFLGFFAWPLMLAVYGSHLVGVLFGVWIKNPSRPPLLKKGRGPEISDNRGLPDEALAKSEAPLFSKEGAGGVNIPRWAKIIVSSLGASLIFFFVTNFVFLYRDYTHNISGIILAYTNGLPFFRGTILGDLVYTAALFAVYELVQIWIKLSQTKQLKA